MKVLITANSIDNYIESDSILYTYDNGGALAIVHDKINEDSALDDFVQTTGAIEASSPTYSDFKTSINDNYFCEIDSHYINGWKVRKLIIIDASNTKLQFNNSQWLIVAETIDNCMTLINACIERGSGSGGGGGGGGWLTFEEIKRIAYLT